MPARPVLAALVAVLLLTPSPARAGDAVAGAAACRDVVVIGARGSGERATGETRGMGPSVFHMANRLRSRLQDDGESVGLLPVTYAAAGVQTLRPSKRQLALLAAGQGAAATALYLRNNVHRYAASIEDGVATTVAGVDAVLRGCADTDVVLMGYSQGAMAVHKAALRLGERSDSAAADAIAGTALLADGDGTARSAARRVGTAPASAKGVRTALRGGGRDVLDPQLTVHICDAGDIVCDFRPARLRRFARASRIHTSYLESRRRRLDDGVDWLAREMLGR